MSIQTVPPRSQAAIETEARARASERCPVARKIKEKLLDIEIAAETDAFVDIRYALEILHLDLAGDPDYRAARSIITRILALPG